MFETYALILPMAVVTFACRYLFFMKFVPIRLGIRVKRALRYTAPSVLTAMWVPIVFLGHKGAEISLMSSPFFYAGLITLVISLLVKNTLLIVGVGTAAFALLNWLL